MACFTAVVICDGAHHVFVLGDNHTGFDPIAQTVIGCLGHLPCCLTGRYQQHTAREFLALQSTGNGLIGLHRTNGCRNNGICMATHHFFHFYSSNMHRFL